MSVRSEVIIRGAGPNEGERLTEITVASRGHWGYEPERLRRWAASLDFAPEQMRESEPYVAEIDGRLIAWAALHLPVDGVCVLDELWVEPAWIGKGIGSQLFRFVVERARKLGARKLEWGAEPGAVGFYEKMGGRYLRDTVSRSFGHVVAVMGLDL